MYFHTFRLNLQPLIPHRDLLLALIFSVASQPFRLPRRHHSQVIVSLPVENRLLREQTRWLPLVQTFEKPQLLQQGVRRGDPVVRRLFATSVLDGGVLVGCVRGAIWRGTLLLEPGFCLVLLQDQMWVCHC